jgi:hypothetical protein
MSDEPEHMWEPVREGYTRDRPLDPDPPVQYRTSINWVEVALVVLWLWAILGVLLPLSIWAWKAAL